MSSSSMGDGGRRKFIKTVVLSTGAVFLDWNVRADAATTGNKRDVQIATLDYKQAHAYLRDNTKSAAPVKPKDVGDVIVVGGGLSGLAAAWQVTKSGKRVTVIDNEASIGGAVRDSMIGDVRADIGTLRFQKTNGAMGAIIADCGLTPVQLPADAYWVDSANIIRDIYSETTLRDNALIAGSPLALRDFRNFFLALDPKPVLPLLDADEALIAQYDMMDPKEILTGHPGAELADWLDTFALATFGRTLSKLSPYAFYATYAAQLGPMFDASWYTFADGMGTLTAALAKKVGADHIRSGSLAVRVENVSDGVHVTVVGANGAVETLAARAAIVATQKRTASHLVADLPGVQQYRMHSIPYAPMVTVQLRCKSTLATRRSFAMWFRDPNRRFFYLHDATYARDLQAGTLDRTTGEFVYTLPIVPLDTSTKSLEDERFLVEYAQKSLAALADFMPYLYDLTTELRIFAWGHALVSPEPGMIGQFFPKASEPFDKIFFAGTDNDVVSTVESAVAHGVHAAERALQVK